MLCFRLSIVIGLIGASIFGFAQGYRSKVHISYDKASKTAIVAKVKNFFTTSSVGDEQLTGEIKPSIRLKDVKTAAETLKGVSAVRFSEPSLDYVQVKKDPSLDWPKVRRAFKARYAEFLDVLSPEQRAKAEQSAPGLGWVDARHYWMERRGILKSDLDIPELQKRAADQAEAMPSEDGLAGWSEFGPGSIEPPPSYYGFGPYPVTGRVNAVAYDPNNASVIWAGTAGGGVWKSTDNGQSWTPMSDQWKSMHISAIAVHPTNSNVVYAGTGDFNGWIFSSAGMYKTVDGGNTWTQLTPTVGWNSINDIIIDPDNPSIVLAATGADSQSAGTLYRSTNSGSAWVAVSDCYALTITGNLFGGYVYLGCDNGREVRRSTDQGATWTTFLLPTPFTAGGADICASDVNISRIFHVSASSERVYESNDWGASWVDISGNLGQAGVWTQANSYNLFLNATKATTTNGVVDVIFLGTRDIYRMIKPSASWSEIGSVYGASPKLHTDQHGMVNHPTASTIGLVVNDGGIYRTSFNPSTSFSSFSGINNDINVFQFYGAAFHPSDKWEMLGGAQDNGTFYQNGRLDQPRVVTGGDGTWPIIRSTSTAQQLTGSQYLSQSDSNGQFRMRRTNDSWETVEHTEYGQGVINEFMFVPIVIPDPTDSDVVYACGRGVYRFNFSTNQWSSRLGNFDFGATIYALAVAPTNGNRLYVAAGQKLFTSGNRGSTWSEITATAPLPAGTAISSISVSPTSSTSIVVTSSYWRAALENNSVLECASTLIAPSWVARTGNLPDAPVNTLERDPDDPTNIWYAGTDVGLFRTTNRGSTWTSFGSAFPDVVVMDLKYVPGQRFMYATTFGRGIWRYGFTTDIEPESYTATGRSQTGALSNLLTQDLSSVTVRPYTDPFNLTRNDRTAWIDVNFTSPVSDPSELRITFSAQQATTNFRTKVQILNYDTGIYEDLWLRNNAFLYSNHLISLDGPESLTEYVSIFRNMRLRFKIEPINSKAKDTTLSLDFVDITVEP